MKCLRGLEIKPFADLSSAFFLLFPAWECCIPTGTRSDRGNVGKTPKMGRIPGQVECGLSLSPTTEPQMQLVGNPKILSWEPKNPEAARPGCGSAGGGGRAGKEWGKGVLKWFDSSLLFSWQ